MQQGTVAKSHNTRHFWLDVARAIAVISITLNHAVNRSWDFGTGARTELYQIPFASTVLKAAMSVIGHLGVPIFLMITGTLLLTKSLESTQSIKKYYRHNIIPILITSEIWYIIMYWFILFVNPDNTSLETNGILGSLPGMFRTMVLYKPVAMRSMWYMPMILQMYIVIPIFSISLKYSDSGKFLLLPCAFLFISNMVIADLKDFVGLMDWNIALSVPQKTRLMYMLYILCGYAISKGALKRLSTKAVFAGAIGLLVFLCAYQIFAFSREYTYRIAYDNSVLLLWGCFVFEALRRKGELLQFAKRSITYLSTISFGIYFVHIILMEAMDWTLQFNGFTRPAKFIVLEFVSFFGSILLIWLLSKNKHLKRYLFMIKS